MRQMKFYGAVRVLIVSICAMLCYGPQYADACTGFKIKNADGTVIHGRTLEFGVEVDSSPVFVPRNYAFTGSLPNGAAGMKYTSKYAAVGSICYGNLALMDGMNEKGLSVGAFYFPTCAGYASVTDANKSIALSSVEFPNWILTQFSTLDEVRAAIAAGKVAIAPTPVNGWGTDAPPLHYIVYDKDGKSIVIEPVDGKLLVFDNPIGVITNSPGFDWQMLNMRNYINLTAENVPPMDMEGYKLLPFGQGGGMHGLPGDFTPPSRFVRAAFISANALAAPDAAQGVYRLFHLMNNFDIPIGIARSIDGAGKLYCDYTQFTVVRDPANMCYYFRTFKDQTIRKIDLKQLKLDSDKAMTVDIGGFTESSADITAQLKPVK